MIKYLIISLLATFVVLGGHIDQDNFDSTPVTDIEQALGKSFEDRKPDMSIPGVSAEAGRLIVEKGFGKSSDGKKVKKQSKHFVCTSCHNTQREDPNLSNIDPQARLDYVSSKGLPFLQGSPLYGAINRKTFYNGDYYLKYGDLVKPAKNDIREAIQLCATECAQGRALKDWEMESVLAYLWEIGLKVGDLDISPQEKNQLITTIEQGTQEASLIEVLESRYPQLAEATFAAPPTDRKKGNGLAGDANNGKKLYEASCLHCHQKGKYSYLHLGKDNMSVKHLRRKAKGYHSHSVYQVSRWGVSSKSGKRSYMPQYPLEKMSEQQLADLVAFLDEGYK